MKINKIKCCICGKPVEGHGNNPAPVKASGRCCNSCNITKVIPARLNYTLSLKEKN